MCHFELPEFVSTLAKAIKRVLKKVSSPLEAVLKHGEPSLLGSSGHLSVNSLTVPLSVVIVLLSGICVCWLSCLD
jgi:hypothetical protein